MKRNVILWIAVLALLGMTGCGNAEPEISKWETIEEADAVTEEPSDSPAIESQDTNMDSDADELEIDFSHDYTEDIKADVDDTVSEAASIQDELKNIEKISEKYMPLATSAQTQMDMNMSSNCFYMIWDTELNTLWSRFSSLADQQTKERVLSEQRNWIDMKEEVTLLTLGSREENGSMYPLLVNSFMEEITKNRAYVLGKELASIKGEAFVMPERSSKYGLFVDNQGTGSVYSSLSTRQNMEESDQASISIYRLGALEGTFIDNGNGELAFTSDSGDIKGTIQINGWNGASFTVTEVSGDSIFAVGDEFSFPYAF